MANYSWIPAFKAITQKLVEYRDKQIELVHLLKNIGIEGGLADKGKDGSIELEEIDPFSFIALIIKHGDEKQILFINKLLDTWQLTEQKKISDVCGIPSSQRLKSWLFSYKYENMQDGTIYERKEEDIPLLWDLFLAIHHGENYAIYFNNALKIKGCGLTNLTQALLRAFPEKFLPVDAQTKPYLTEKGIILPEDNYESYKNFLGIVQGAFDQPFYQISHMAWQSNNLTVEYVIATLDDDDNLDTISKTIDIKQYRSKINNAEFAVLLKNKTPTLFIEATDIANEFNPKEYPIEKNRNSNLKSKLSSKYAVQQIRIKSPTKFSEFLNLYLNEKTAKSLLPIENITGEAMPKVQTKITPSLNTILYGPPGTGKTFHTVDKAVNIINPSFLGTRKEYKDEYDRLVAAKKIRFVTFHQSFSYEDFVEGIRPETSENNTLTYPVQNGIFKEISLAAKNYKEFSLTDGDTDHSLFEKDVVVNPSSIWKLSLGDNKDKSNKIYNECIENEYILLGHGWDIDFTNCKNMEEVKLKHVKSGKSIKEKNDGGVHQVNDFVNKMKINDLVIISAGNSSFRAIGRITGEYKYRKRIDEEGYMQCREVKWLCVLENYLSHKLFMDKKFTQSALYMLREPTLNKEKLFNFIKSFANSENNEIKVNINKISSENNNFVLILDEINRGNISRIFGELITLIEDDKRIGVSNEQHVILPYSKKPFSVPKNLHILGTMNTADRSLSGIDIALRRRFQFEEMMPEPSLLKKIQIDGINLVELLSVMNERIEILLGRDYMIGHSYFIKLRSNDNLEESGLPNIFKNKIIPLLQEYFYEDWERIQWVLNDHCKNDMSHRFIQKTSDSDEGRKFQDLFGVELDLPKTTDKRWTIYQEAFANPQSYVQIYKTMSSNAE